MRPEERWPAEGEEAQIELSDDDQVYLRALTGVTGLRAAVLPSDARLAVGGRILPRGRTFCDLPQGRGLLV